MSLIVGDLWQYAAVAENPLSIRLAITMIGSAFLIAATLAVDCRPTMDRPFDGVN
jgi:hypothetical protein